MMKKISDVLGGKRFLSKCLKGLFLTSEHGKAEYCLYCGIEKHAFHDPITDRIYVLECECEKRFKSLGEFLKINVEWLNEPAKANKTIPNYSTPEAREAQMNFVRRVRQEYDQMQAKRDVWQARLKQAA
jgi:hypothetical protein